MSNKVWNALRILLGLGYTVFGLNFFFHFLPQPPMGESAVTFIMALIGSGYLFTLLKVTEIVGGLLLLSGKATPFALVLLAPITVNIVAFHLFLDPATGMAAYLIGAIHIALAATRFEPYKALFK